MTEETVNTSIVAVWRNEHGHDIAYAVQSSQLIIAQLQFPEAEHYIKVDLSPEGMVTTFIQNG